MELILFNFFSSIYDCYQLVASHLRQFIVLKSGIDYLQKNFSNPELQENQKIYEIIYFVRQLKRSVELMTNRIVHVRFLMF